MRKYPDVKSMLVITEDYEMVSARMCVGKGVSIRTHPQTPSAQLAVFNTVNRTLGAIIGTFPTSEIAGKARVSLRKTHMEDKLRWAANALKTT